MANAQEIIDRLNKLYWTDVSRYQDYLQRVKQAGYKVYRNSKGEHKVEDNVFNQIFGGIFK